MTEPTHPPFKVDQPVDIVLPDPGQAAENENIYFSKILSIKEDVLLIAPPVLDGTALPPPQEPLEVTCRLPADTWVWAFNSRIPSILGDTWVLERPPENQVVREQRRGNIRASLTLEIQAALHMANRYFPETTLRILDLSSSGCQVAGDRPFIPNSVMRLRIPLGTQTLEVHGKIVRANPFPQGIHQRYYVSGFHFSDLSQPDRESLVRFIFEHLSEDIRGKRQP